MLAVQQQCAALLQLQYMLCICRTACSAEADALKCFVVQLNPHFTRLFNSGAGEPPQAQAAGSSGKGRLARLRCTSPLMLLSLHLSHVAVACGSSSPAHLCIGASCCTLGAHAACQCFCQSQMLNVTLNTAQRVLLHQVQQHLIADMVFSWLVPQARLTTRRPWRSAAASAPPARAAPPPRPALALCRPGPTTTATVPPPPPAATAAMAANTPCRPPEWARRRCWNWRLAPWRCWRRCRRRQRIPAASLPDRGPTQQQHAHAAAQRRDRRLRRRHGVQTCHKSKCQALR